MAGPNENDKDDSVLPALQDFEFKEKQDDGKAKAGVEASRKRKPTPDVGVGDQRDAVEDAKRRGGSASQKFETKGWDCGEWGGHAGTTKEGDGDRTYGTNFATSAKCRAGKFSLAPDGSKAEFTAVDVELKTSVHQSRWHIYSSKDRVAWHPTLFLAVGPQAARAGDPTVHGIPLSGLGSPDTFAGGRPMWRAGIDLHVCPHVNAVVPHVGGITAPPATGVFVNGLRAARAGDVVVEAGGGPNPIVTGAPDVLIGPPAPAVNATEPGPPEDGWFNVELYAVGELGHAEAKAELGGAYDHGEGRAGAGSGAMAALLRGQLVGKIEVGPDWLPIKPVFELTGEAVGLTAGADAGANAVFNTVDPNTGKKKFVSTTAGAKAGAGIAGGGAKFEFSLEER